MWYQRFISHIKGRRNSSHCAQTIYALSSGQGKCGVAVVRVSGSNAANAILKMSNVQELPKPRMAILKHLYDPVTREKLDRGLILWFPGPKSFTGEDCCEFQVHGGPAVVASILSALSKLQNFRPAEAGEFTKRAFINGKLDLVEIEGLGDLIHAETEMQRKQALLQMEGSLSKLYNKWRTALIQNLAHVEAFIDFGEDENIEENILEVANEELLKVKKEIEKHLSDGRKGERLRHGVRTTIVGEPNAGKSSLFNALCKRPAAIVTPIAGTTRDLIEIHINVSGYPVALTDTAGLRKETSDEIEQEGISRAHATIKTSDLLLIMIDSTALKNTITTSDVENKFNNFLENYLKVLGLSDLITNGMIVLQKGSELVKTHTCNCIFLFNKIDLLSEEQKTILHRATAGRNMICLSCITEDGFSSFINIFTTHLKLLCGNPSEEDPSLTQIRHRHHLSECCQCLNQYFTITEDLPVAAHHLRKGLNHLGKITGQVNSEEILDVIFKDFCIASPKFLSSSSKPEVLASSLEIPHHFLFSETFNPERKAKLLNDMKVYENYITTEEENSMFNELEPIMKRLRYERHHWDYAITGYRETEKLQWNASNAEIINKVKKLAFSNETDPLKYVHVLDLKSEGVIKPHIDSVKFCGNTIAGLSLLSDSVMRLSFNEEKKEYLDVLLKRRSLYIMTGSARYDYTHEILANEESKFGNDIVIKTRRISVICRNKP